MRSYRGDDDHYTYARALGQMDEQTLSGLFFYLFFLLVIYPYTVYVHIFSLLKGATRTHYTCETVDNKQTRERLSFYKCWAYPFSTDVLFRIEAPIYYTEYVMCTLSYNMSYNT